MSSDSNFDGSGFLVTKFDPKLNQRKDSIKTAKIILLLRNVSILTSLGFILFAFTDNLKLSPDIIFWIITWLSAIGNLFSAALFNIINRSWAVEIVYEDSKKLLKLNVWLRIGSA